MKSELVSLIRILGIGCTELVIDIDLERIVINSVEFREPDEVYLHHFTDYGFDFEIEFDDISLEDQKIVFWELKSLLYN